MEKFSDEISSNPTSSKQKKIFYTKEKLSKPKIIKIKISTDDLDGFLKKL